ncbi:ribonucleoside triphosphate reductase [Anoxybacter fermentans]|uniref:Ribonucleoside triphosphate reductase n=1 Tax=Anoxybacter fermentans TaxID=1323375 RepID=A0A3S9SWY7_9FIRM|nr:ribonucleoside triphosphate reductase [Anoxybacter fermentans]AZR72819.1 ribonucleoside triphosphate reductase [Anoxybacter fermentans]
MKTTIQYIIKRDGRKVKFDQNKITTAIGKAFKAAGTYSAEEVQRLSDKVVSYLELFYKQGGYPQVEMIQDLVEKILMDEGYTRIARAYILYREQHAKIRKTKALLSNAIQMVNDYLNQADWRVSENSNMTYSLQGLHNHISSNISAHYWLHEIYPTEIRDAHLQGDFHIHDLSHLSVYCCGWDLKLLLQKGFGGVSSKIESAPPKHFRTALGQIVNFFYTLQGEAAGAQAFSNFDTYLAPYVYYDGLNYKEVKQAIQEFVFNMNVPTRVGFQTPFTNITFDLKPSGMIKNEPVIIAGQVMDKTYGEFQKEMDMINRAFAEVMLEGDAKGRVFSFPIPTYNITADFDWANPVLDPIWEMTAKYGIPYFSNFINSDMSPDDARSMCCRLRLDNRELRKRGGGLFGANPMTGSIGVVTINMPRLGYLTRGNRKAFFDRLEELMDLAKESLEIKRKVLEKFTEAGLYPYSRYFLKDVKARFGQYWKNHFNTIGLNGMNECLLNFMGKNIASHEGRRFAIEVLDFMRAKMLEYQEETDNLYNLEATPAEGTAYRFARLDKELYPNIICANEEAYRNGAAPYYTNSTHLPVGYTDDIFDALDLQDELQTRYTGGTVFHGFLGERLPDGESCKLLVKRIAENYRLPYFTITPTFSICPVHGYLPGAHEFCPKCDAELELEEKNQE